MEQVQQQAREEGRAAGYEEGRQAAAAEAQRLAGLLEATRTALGQLDQSIADQLLGLALEIAQRVVTEALAAKPELILPIVQEAVRCIPDFEQPVRILLHPDDAALVQAHLAAQAAAGGWVIVPDPATTRGGCRLKTATTGIDATLAERWKRVLGALGQNREWLP
jgi:flagellar assembly protein FliH